MNYLAHLALSPEDPAIMLANFLADSVRPIHVEAWPAVMRSGYQLHIDIDRYTDAHPAFKLAVVRLRDNHKKYAPVVLDILNDHLLAKRWERHQETTFDVWSDQVYSSLSSFQSLSLPPKAERLYQGLMTHRYLHVYKHREGIIDVLGRMDKRARFASNFVQGETDLYSDLRFFEDCFDGLYADLRATFDK